MKQSSSVSLVASHKLEQQAILMSPSSVTASWSSTSCAMADAPPRRHSADTMLSHALRNGFQECTWRHQRRHLNKMADALANMAIDLGRSTSYSSFHPLPSSISRFLANDVWPTQ
ncbi:TPA: hypothetical protein N0F65_012890 [Lagenidium giganteum]|uniref:RNase H type-1 domain-containing protein n=1 Tax=Lagenidium giganteum TaxID=4803 RepID=A0AAV2YMN1_9STRA|nr:TPA: hypothetical protein N0F65_012890 [Lagenidium giganteum]